MSTEKIDFLVANNFLIENEKLMFEFVDNMYNLHEFWCGYSASEVLKFL